MTKITDQLRKYFIMGSQNCSRSPLVILEEAIQGGISAFQFREKGMGSLTGLAKLKLGEQLREICLNYNVPFFINDDIDLVEPLKVEGIHVGQDDLSVIEIRRRYPELTIGLSISNRQELLQSPIHLIDYVGAGPVFSTQTKEDVKSVVGLNWIGTLRREFRSLPLVGIGGITPNNAEQVLKAGANGVAVISAITQAKDVKDSVSKL